ncbi:MAG: Asp-tRNA(Asn)/Glu-tRNA(Gln) amidotransferase subunit GatC [Elusimicrobia bacterium]|nr:Asp-tRNA(Asn)/Glu-tRNA(Gln) amidotransferase subunit GatC [Candidatus Obscuribacterium magneticum]
MAETIITKKDVEYVAKLARIAISPEELEKYQAQLERILGYVSQLRTKNTDDVLPTAHPLQVANVWRADEAHPFPHLPDLFKNAPEMEETFYKVKKVIE